MKYIMKTIMINGVEKIEIFQNPNDRRKSLYTVKDLNGNVMLVDRNWVKSNIDNITNVTLGRSGCNFSLYLRNEDKNKSATSFPDFKVKKDISYKYFQSELLSFIEHDVLNKLNRMRGLRANYYTEDCSYSNTHPKSVCFIVITEKNNSYSLSPRTGCLGFLCDIESTKDSVVLTYSLIKLKSDYTYYISEYDILYTYVKKTIVLLDKTTNTINPLDYNVSNYKKGKKFDYYLATLLNNYPNNFYILTGKECYNDNSLNYTHFIDEKIGEKLLELSKTSLMAFLEENKKLIKEKSVLPDGFINYQQIEGYGSHAYKTIETAYALEKKGYTIIVDDVEMSAAELEKKRDNDLKTHNTWGTMNNKYYTDIQGFVDKRHKKFYVKLGRIDMADMWC